MRRNFYGFDPPTMRRALSFRASSSRIQDAAPSGPPPRSRLESPGMTSLPPAVRANCLPSPSSMTRSARRRPAPHAGGGFRRFVAPPVPTSMAYPRARAAGVAVSASFSRPAHAVGTTGVQFLKERVHRWPDIVRDHPLRLVPTPRTSSPGSTRQSTAAHLLQALAA